MQTKVSPYEPISPELAAKGFLIPIKQAAKNNACCEGTLKANAKSRRLPAFQASFGSPVMVMPSDVEEFLKSRPDIASKHQPKLHPAVQSAGLPADVSIPLARSLPPFSSTENPCRPFVELGVGVGITLGSLAHSSPAERVLVAKTLSEIARAINETVQADA